MYLKNKILYFSLLLCLTVKPNYGQNPNPYYRFLDSSDVHVAGNPEKNLAFLDSIPKPVENYIQGRIGEYYIARVNVHGDYNEKAMAIQCFLLGLKYAEIEKEYEVAGDACVQLFRCSFPTADDSISFGYLDKAKHYFELCNYNIGLLEIELIQSYIKYQKGDIISSNLLLLKNIHKYKKVIEEDGYLYMSANIQLALNYIHLDSIKKAHKYFKEFKTTKDNPTISSDNYNAFNGEFNIDMAEYFFENKQLDSSIYYIEKTKKYLKFMDETYVTFYYNLCIDVYENDKNLKLSRTYLDSLRIYKNQLLENNLNATINIGNSIGKVESRLKAESDKTYRNKLLVFALIFILIIISVTYYNFHRKQRYKLIDASNKVNKLSYIKSNNEKLAVKVQGLEDYITNLKKEVKEISKLDESNQKTKIKEFYTNLHHNSSILLDKTENHLELVNDLNVDFFNNLQEKYPELNNSEIAICYYLSIGFKNKEIAVFINSTIRAVESKRYRISKKMDLNNTTLTNYLNDNF